MRILLPSELKKQLPSSNTLNELYISSPELVGREDELRVITDHLTQSTQRLITIIGPGGIGKSRLALEIAVKQGDQFENGVYFVSLVSVNSPELILSAVADEFRFSPQSRIDLKSRFLSYLNGKKALVVLDNFEHLLKKGVGPSGVTDGTEVLKELLIAAPSVKFLLTSRQRVGLRAEWVFELQGLPFPKVNTDPDLESYSAFRLFLKDASTLCPGRVFSDQEREQVARICRLASGMPLGINLAASWVRTLSCKEIADEIEKNLDFLTVDDTDIPPRHRSLRHVFEQSWVNLSENEKQVLKRFSVFRNGCRKEAAQQIAEAPLVTLSSLIDKSLLSRKSAGSNDLQSRYDLHEMLRQFAEEKLMNDQNDNYKTRQAHCDYYVNYVKQRAASLISGGQVESVAEIEEEIANIQAAWKWADSQDQYEALSLLVSVLTHFYDIRGSYQSALESFDHLIDKLSANGVIPTEVDDEKDTLRLVLLGKLLLRQGFLHSRLSRYKKAKSLIAHSLSIFRQINGFDDELAFALNYLGHVECFIGEYSESAVHCQEALAIRKKLGDMVRVGDTLINIGFGAYMTGEFASAKAISERIVEIADAKKDQRGLAIGLGSLAYVDLELGNYDEAERAFEKSIATCEEVGLQWFTPWFMTHWGMVARAKGEYENAENICTKALALAQEIGDQFRQIHALVNLASIKASRGSLDDAHREAMRAIKMSKEVDHYFGLARSLNVLAEVAFAGKNMIAAKHFAEESIAINRARNQQACLAAALNTLGKVAWERKAFTKSREHLHEALATSLKIEAVPLALDCLLSIAEIRAHLEDSHDAQCFLRMIFQHPKSKHDTRLHAEQLIDARADKELLLQAAYDESIDAHSADEMLKDMSVKILQERN